ncbi:phosphoheptose isomerase [Pontibacter sp. MBLB2868]|uniref:phosphoheptose isomerase n=1 Tax=Pontibacter sp. MBLB2868 TaxID=3451555 RepID=UPI003F74E589
MINENEKEALFQEIEQELTNSNFEIVKKDDSRPWGGFFVINEDQAKEFAEKYFTGIPLEELKISGKLSPKFLLVAPGKRLSWQYHHRRAEIWKVLQGKVGVVTSATDQEGDLQELEPGTLITLQQGERHRLVGLNEWSVLAEIWQHTDLEKPSDEEDIVRVQDDFGR